jgi:hypothetical protein
MAAKDVENFMKAPVSSPSGRDIPAKLGRKFGLHGQFVNAAFSGCGSLASRLSGEKGPPSFKA